MADETCLRGKLPAPDGAENYREEHYHGAGYCRITRRWDKGGKSVLERTSYGVEPIALWTEEGDDEGT